MLSIPATTNIFIVTGVTDLRKSYDTLAAIVSENLSEDPFTGDIFVFCNRRRNRLKMLVWEPSGFWLLSKRLEQGTFSWPKSAEASVNMTYAELAMLLDGIDASDAVRRRWYERPGTERRRTFVQSR